MRSIRTLCARLIDYAGLFPPAGLPMDAAVANYAAYSDGPDRWALGRFVVPASRLDEFEEAFGQVATGGRGWQLSALLGSDSAADIERIRHFNAARGNSGDGPVVDTVEARASDSASIARLPGSIPTTINTFVELPLGGNLAALLAEVKAAGLHAKIRTGGLTGDAFPVPEALLGFVDGCIHAGLTFKATAGLHHPLRANYRLTYAADSPSAPMYGFFNVFLAAALLRSGGALHVARDLLLEGRAGAFAWSDLGVTWHDMTLTIDDLRRTREELALSFGSCSFSEPIDDLKAIGLL